MNKYRRVIFSIAMDIEVKVDEDGDPVEYADELLGLTDQKVTSFLVKSGRKIENFTFDTFYE